jgi:hypothetical protein
VRVSGGHCNFQEQMVNVVLFFHMVSGEATGLLTVISKEALPVV